jgi:hypothetical protein
VVQEQRRPPFLSVAAGLVAHQFMDDMDRVDRLLRVGVWRVVRQLATEQVAAADQAMLLAETAQKATFPSPTGVKTNGYH